MLGAKPRGTVISGDWRGPNHVPSKKTRLTLSLGQAARTKGAAEMVPSPLPLQQVPGKCQQERGTEQSSSTSSHPACLDCSSLVLSSSKRQGNHLQMTVMQLQGERVRTAGCLCYHGPGQGNSPTLGFLPASLDTPDAPSPGTPNAGSFTRRSDAGTPLPSARGRMLLRVMAGCCLV